MLKLYSFGKHFGVVDPSPFVLKVNVYMKMSGIEFENVVHQKNLSLAPKGKLPFIEDKGKKIADSQFIFSYFQKELNCDLDSELSDEQKAVAYLVSKSLDENLYFVLVYSRWLRDDTWPLVKQSFFGRMPAPLKLFIPTIIRKQVAKGLKGQGITRHSNDELQIILQRTLQSLSDLLGSKKYFFGDNPSSLDATAYGFLAEFILTDIDNPFNDIAQGYPVLVDYCKHIEKEYYS